MPSGTGRFQSRAPMMAPASAMPISAAAFAARFIAPVSTKVRMGGPIFGWL